jgi:hypothetical protein
MLDKLEANDFLPYVGQACEMLAADGSVLPVVLESVVEKPLARNPDSPNPRIPFSLSLTGPADTNWRDGSYTLRFSGGRDIPGVFVGRILNTSPTPRSCFQAVFS